MSTIKFDPPQFTASFSRDWQENPHDINIEPGLKVTVRYRGKQTFVDVTQILHEHLYEGIIRDIGGMSRFGEHKQGDTVRFRYEDIEHRIRD